MKTIIVLIASVLFWCSSFGQTSPPDGMLYQAVARDASGNLASKRTIFVQTSILKGGANGIIVYSDEHKVISNADAMFNVVVGQGKYLTGLHNKIAEIPWGKDKYFFNLKICVAPTLPKSGWQPKFTDMGTSQFWSTPYALFAGRSSDSLLLTVNGTGRQLRLGNYQPIYFSVADSDSNSSNEIQQISLKGGNILLSLNGGMISLPDSSSLNELQHLSRNGGKISLSLNGGEIALPDSSSSNELQNISRVGGNIFLSQNGGLVSLPDSSSNNELQTISRIGGNVHLSQNGGSFTLPDSSSTNEIQTLKLKSDSLILSISNGVDLYPILGAGTVKMKDYKIPDGLMGAQKIKYTIVPTTTSSPSTTPINAYTVPSGKNLYIRKVLISTPYWQCAAGLYVNSNLILPTAGVGCAHTSLDPILVGENMVVTANLGCPGSLSCSTWYCEIDGYLVDKTVPVIFEKTNYTVPVGHVFIKVSNSYNFPEIYTAGEIVPAYTNGYLLKK
jgi:hypothetical protein